MWPFLALGSLGFSLCKNSFNRFVESGSFENLGGHV